MPPPKFSTANQILHLNVWYLGDSHHFLGPKGLGKPLQHCYQLHTQII